MKKGNRKQEKWKRVSWIKKKEEKQGFYERAEEIHS